MSENKGKVLIITVIHTSPLEDIRTKHAFLPIFLPVIIYQQSDPSQRSWISWRCEVIVLRWSEVGCQVKRIRSLWRRIINIGDWWPPIKLFLSTSLIIISCPRCLSFLPATKDFLASQKQQILPPTYFLLQRLQSVFATGHQHGSWAFSW